MGHGRRHHDAGVRDGVNMSQRFRAARLWWRGLTAADRIPTETTPDEKDTLFRLARRRAGGTAVEIGSAEGASSCFIAAGVRPGGGVLYCVDLWNIEYRPVDGRIDNFHYGEDGRLRRYAWSATEQRVLFEDAGPARACPTYERFLMNTRRFAETIVPVRQDSADAAAHFDRPIDFLFVDAWHESDAVKRDCDGWLPKVRAGGIVVLHDAGWAPGVQRAIEDEVVPRSDERGCLPNLFWAVLR
jgi:predicted O-methyltransferase YrrM